MPNQQISLEAAREIVELFTSLVTRDGELEPADRGVCEKALASLIERREQAVAIECAQIADGACPTFVLRGSRHKAALIRDAICRRFKLGQIKSDAGALVSRIVGHRGNSWLPDDWVTTGWSRQPQIGTTRIGPWLEMGHSASEVSDPPPMPPELPAQHVADKLNELEADLARAEAEIDRLTKTPLASPLDSL